MAASSALMAFNCPAVASLQQTRHLAIEVRFGRPQRQVVACKHTCLASLEFPWLPLEPLPYTKVAEFNAKSTQHVFNAKSTQHMKEAGRVQRCLPAALGLFQFPRQPRGAVSNQQGLVQV